MVRSVVLHSASSIRLLQTADCATAVSHAIVVLLHAT
jgi:hypothetical protein